VVGLNGDEPVEGPGRADTASDVAADAAGNALARYQAALPATRTTTRAIVLVGIPGAAPEGVGVRSVHHLGDVAPCEEDGALVPEAGDNEGVLCGDMRGPWTCCRRWCGR